MRGGGREERGERVSTQGELQAQQPVAATSSSGSMRTVILDACLRRPPRHHPRCALRRRIASVEQNARRVVGADAERGCGLRVCARDAVVGEWPLRVGNEAMLATAGQRACWLGSGCSLGVCVPRRGVGFRNGGALRAAQPTHACSPHTRAAHTRAQPTHDACSPHMRAAPWRPHSRTVRRRTAYPTLVTFAAHLSQTPSEHIMSAPPSGGIATHVQ